MADPVQSTFQRTMELAQATGRGFMDVCMDPLMHLVGIMDEKLHGVTQNMSLTAWLGNFAGGGDGFISAPSNTTPVDLEPVGLTGGRSAGHGVSAPAQDPNIYVQQTQPQAMSLAMSNFQQASIDVSSLVPPGTVAPTLAQANNTFCDLPEFSLCSAYIEKPTMGVAQNLGQGMGMNA